MLWLSCLVYLICLLVVILSSILITLNNDRFKKRLNLEGKLVKLVFSVVVLLFFSMNLEEIGIRTIRVLLPFLSHVMISFFLSSI